MSEQPASTLVRLSDTDGTVPHPSQDVRGRMVLDNGGADIGMIADLLVDPEHAEVRFLLVEHGGVHDFGATPSFIPVDAVVRVAVDSVHIDHSVQHVAGATRNDPDPADQQIFYNDLYGYYGYTRL